MNDTEHATPPAQGLTQLWSDEYIQGRYKLLKHISRASQAIAAVTQEMRDDYEAERTRLADEAAALRAELAAVLEVAMARGALLDYSDDDYKARYTELTGKENWEDEDNNE